LSAWLSLDDALEKALSIITPLTQSERVSIYEALGRVSSKDVLAPVNVPPWANSAMDGYALWVDNTQSQTRQVTGTIAAGDKADIIIDATTCARIMTGAPVPDGANAVVIQENVEREGDIITLAKQPKPGENIRPCASDIAQGDKIIQAGHALTAADLVLLSSLGLSYIDVVRKPKVAVIATGNELVEPGQALGDNKIYESHRAGLCAKISAMQCDVTNAGIAKDDPESIKQRFADLAQTHDMVISSGGVSVGDADWVKPALSSLGSLHLWKVAIKPGKPFAFGQFGDCYFCGLPGNPVSAYVTFEQLASVLLTKLKGEKAKQKLTLKARLTHDYNRRAGRLDFARATFKSDAKGELSVTLHSKQSSGVMTSITQANCYALLPAEQSVFSQGEMIQIQPFSLLN